jgi:hypothetical protein
MSPVSEVRSSLQIAQVRSGRFSALVSGLVWSGGLKSALRTRGGGANTVVEWQDEA